MDLGSTPCGVDDGGQSSARRAVGSMSVTGEPGPAMGRSGEQPAEQAATFTGAAAGGAPPSGDGSSKPSQDTSPAPADKGAPARRGGRNLPVAAAVGVSLGGLALLSLLTVKATFLILAGAVEALALWELRRATATRGIRLPVVPVAVGGAAMVTCEYWLTNRAVLAALALTVVATLGWRLSGGTDGYLRDVAAGVLAVGYLPLMAVFISAMLAPPDGARRVLVFIILTVCSDVGGYFAGVALGRHSMARTISPNKTWEGFAGSVVACLAAGAAALPTLLGGQVWQGIVAGAAAVVAATAGDLAESMIKRDLGIKDMGSVLPGHGGALDRIDSLLVCAPVMWLVLTALVPVR